MSTGAHETGRVRVEIDEQERGHHAEYRDDFAGGQITALLREHAARIACRTPRELVRPPSSRVHGAVTAAQPPAGILPLGLITASRLPSFTNTGGIRCDSSCFWR